MRSADKREIEGLVAGLRSGEMTALARLLSLVENQVESRREIMSRLYPVERHPFVLGVTGAAGSGKSTLINQMLSRLQQRFSPIAVLGFDPSSRLTGGALLGDRVRMKEHELDETIYVRSMADRGHGGGVGSCVFEALVILSVFGFELVVVETVGAGQGETEIAGNADMVLVVLTPDFGDDIQAMKAGILEMGDVFAVNKADVMDAAAAESVLVGAASLDGEKGERIEVCSTAATEGTGVEALIDTLLKKRERLHGDGVLARRRTQRARTHFERIVRARWQEYMDRRIEEHTRLSDRIGFEENPYELAEAFVDRVLKSKDGEDAEGN